METIRKFNEINPIVPEYQRDPKKTGNALPTIAESMKKYGVLQYPVCVKLAIKDQEEQYVLVDGSHRIVAAEKADMLNDLKVIISSHVCHSNREVIEIMQILNNTQTAWRLPTYISFFAKSKESNYSSYEFLIVKHHNTNIGYECLACICTGQTKHVVNRLLKKGEFKVVDKQLSTKVIVNFITFMSSLTKITPKSDTQCAVAVKIRAYTRQNQSFDVEEFLRYLKTDPTFSQKMYDELCGEAPNK